MIVLPEHLCDEIESAWIELQASRCAVTLRLTITGKILGFLDEDDEEGEVIGSYNCCIPLSVFTDDVRFVYEQMLNVLE